jgi:hypothetical protein
MSHSIRKCGWPLWENRGHPDLRVKYGWYCARMTRDSSLFFLSVLLFKRRVLLTSADNNKQPTLAWVHHTTARPWESGLGFTPSPHSRTVVPTTPAHNVTQKQQRKQQTNKVNPPPQAQSFSYFRSLDRLASSTRFRFVASTVD